MGHRHDIACCCAVEEEGGEHGEGDDESGEGSRGGRQGVVGWAVNTASSTVRGVARTAGSAAGGIASRAGKSPWTVWQDILLLFERQCVFPACTAVAFSALSPVSQ